MSSAPTTEAPGWDAIDRALGELYPAQVPHQFTSKTPFQLDQPSPLPAITVWESDAPASWHLVTYGLSELFDKVSDDPRLSGFGYEFTLKIPRSPGEQRPPAWALRMLQALGRHVLLTRADYDSGSLLRLGPEMTPGLACELRGVACVPDPQLGKLDTPHGSLLFLRLVGLTQGELEALEPLGPSERVGVLAELDAQALTDPTRADWSLHPEKAKILLRCRLGIRL